MLLPNKEKNLPLTDLGREGFLVSYFEYPIDTCIEVHGNTRKSCLKPFEIKVFLFAK